MSVMFCVLPIDLGLYIDELKQYCAGENGIEVVVERRTTNDRRQTPGRAPDGTERRLRDRRAGGVMRTATEADMVLPPSLRAHAERVACTWRSLPVNAEDAEREAAELLADADSDHAARNELHLRYHRRVYDSMHLHDLTREQALEMTERVFDDLFAHHGSDSFSSEVTGATGRVLAGRWPRPA
jgi:hypothetical protein